MCRLKILVLATLILAPTAQGFVLLSGPNEAKLAATPTSPTVTLVWDEQAPSIQDKDEIGDGLWQNLSDVDFMEQLILLAITQWNQVPGSYLSLELVRDAAAELNRDDFAHTIAVNKSSNLTSAAFAAPVIKRDEIVDCDISIADTKTSAKNLAYTIVHELGHCIGLGHAHTNYNAVMGYSRSDRSVALGADDMAGIIYLYPDPAYGSTPPLPLKCGTIAGHRSPSSATWLLVLAPILVAMSRRYRRRLRQVQQICRKRCPAD